VVNLRALEPINERAAQRRTLLAQCCDCLSYLGRRAEILLDQRGEPSGVLVCDLHRPSQTGLLQFKASLNSRGRRDPQQRGRLAVHTERLAGLRSSRVRVVRCAVPRPGGTGAASRPGIPGYLGLAGWRSGG
jgi:hypothetical protein